MLEHGQFALDGHVFGEGHAVYAAHVTHGGQAWRTDDVANPVGHNLWMGTDYADLQPIVLDLKITGDNPAAATEELERFANIWRAARKRGPGAESVLAWGKHGHTRRAYGRPRLFEPEAGDLYVLETAPGEATFQPNGPYVYQDTARELPLTITPGKAGGLVFPIVFPWGTVQGGIRQGVIEDGGGTVPTDDVTLTVRGPINRPTVRGPGWQVALSTNLAWDRSITINVRQRTALWDNGSSAAGILSRRTRLADITIPPGPSEIRFEGEDQSGTSQLLVSWRPAYTSI